MLIHSELGEDGVLLATIDMPERSMNVFSFALMDALEAVLEDVEATPEIRSVVLTSGKPSFLAGADLAMVRGFTEPRPEDTEAVMFQRCGRLGRLFVRLEACAKPWVAAVNGTALGGGLELAMACHARLVADDPRTLLGLPEVRWGLLPGAGGTQRLPRFIGFDAAMAMLLTGQPTTPQRAVELGLVARAVAVDALLDEARALARSLHGATPTLAGKFPHGDQRDVPPHAEATARAIARAHGVSDADFARYPAYGAIIDSVLLGARQPMAQAGDTEMRQFLRLMFDPVAGNMVRTLFLNRQRADRDLAAPRDLRIERVTLGPVSAARAAWRDALAKSRLAHGTDPGLPVDTADLLDNRGASHRIALRTLDEAPPAPSTPSTRFETATAILSPAGPYGSTVEIVAADDGTAQAAAAMATRLGALPYRTPGPASALMSLAASADGGGLDAQALTALDLVTQGIAQDPVVLDVAACAAGITPAYSGGPFNWLWQERERLVPGLAPAAAAAWPGLQERLARSYPA